VRIELRCNGELQYQALIFRSTKSMQRITKHSFTIEVLGNRESVGIVDRDKPYGQKPFATPKRTTT